MNVILYIFSFYLMSVYKCDLRLILKVLILWGDSGKGGISPLSLLYSLFKYTLILTHVYAYLHIPMYSKYIKQSDYLHVSCAHSVQG